MVYRLSPDDVRHARGPCVSAVDGTDAVVESHRVACSHFDAFRFFTDDARPLNTLQPGRDDRPAFEQPACLHAGMDLYKHAFRLSPWSPSDAGRRLLRARPGHPGPRHACVAVRLQRAGRLAPVRVETADGKQEYVAAQRDFAERGAPLRARLVAACERLLEAIA